MKAAYRASGRLPPFGFCACIRTAPQLGQTHLRFLWKERFCSRIALPHRRQIIGHTPRQCLSRVRGALPAPYRPE
jgi:hypothetical protein